MEKKTISIYNLADNLHFEKILQYNLDHIHVWNRIYPHHKAWIENVIDELKNETYKRIAFGGFDSNNNDEMCCSAIVKKDLFSPYLEIKNIIVIRDNATKDEKISYFKQLVFYIIEYSKQRGFQRIITEVFNKSESDKDLINALIENEFKISGNHFNKYGYSDDVMYFTRNIDIINFNDPYDDIDKSKWILSKYLNVKVFEKMKHKVHAIDENNKLKEIHNIYSFSFFIGSKHDVKSVESNFNLEGNLIIIPEHFKELKGIKYIKGVEFNNKENNETYIFDYSYENDDFQNFPILENSFPINSSESNNSNSNLIRCKLFRRSQLSELLGESKLPNIKRNEMGGLLLISNPKLFPIEKYRKIDPKKNKIYIKLGDYGKHLEKGMKLIFAYPFPYSNPKRLRIWAFCVIESKEFININELPSAEKNNDSLDIYLENFSKNDNFLTQSTKDVFTILNKKNSEILWKPIEFEKHNRYNSANKIIGFEFKKLEYYLKVTDDGKEFDLENYTTLLDVSKILTNKVLENEILNRLFDLYLSNDQMERFSENLKKIKLPEKPSPPRKKPSKPTSVNKLKLIFVSAEPSDKEPINYAKEYQTIKSFFDMGAELNCTYEDFQKIDLDKYNILHFSGHGDETGLYLVNSNTQKYSVFKKKQIFHFFEKNKSSVNLVVFNSCQSSKLSQEVSNCGFFAIGFKKELDYDSAQIFAENFYSFFNRKDISFEKNVILGCNNFIMNSPENKENLTLWKDGKQIKNFDN